MVITQKDGVGPKKRKDQIQNKTRGSSLKTNDRDTMGSAQKTMPYIIFIIQKHEARVDCPNLIS